MRFDVRMSPWEPSSVIKTLIDHFKPSEEDRLLESLLRLSTALERHDSHWAKVLATLHGEATTAFTDGSPVSCRYQIARKIEGLFGGMGSLNDIEMPGRCQQMSDELYAAVQNVLRVYWRELGRPSHNLRVALFPVGAAVRLVPGRVRYYNRDESPVVIEDTPAVKSEVWHIVGLELNDITNMPQYLIQRENAFMLARHESLELSPD
jgi:hypothetical protein